MFKYELWFVTILSFCFWKCIGFIISIDNFVSMVVLVLFFKPWHFIKHLQCYNKICGFEMFNNWNNICFHLILKNLKTYDTSFKKWSCPVRYQYRRNHHMNHHWHLLDDFCAGNQSLFFICFWYAAIIQFWLASSQTFAVFKIKEPSALWMIYIVGCLTLWMLSISAA